MFRNIIANKLDKFPKLAIIGFFYGFAFTSINAFWSLLLFETVGLNKSEIGYFSAIMSIITILTMMFIVPRITEKYNERKLAIFAYLIVVISYILLITTSSIIIFGVILYFAMVFTRIADSEYNIIFKNSSLKEYEYRNYGILYSLRNIAGIIAPSIAGVVVAAYSVKANIVYAATIFLIGATLFYFLTRRYKPIKSKNHHKFNSKDIKEFFSNYDYLRAYMVNVGTHFWYFFLVIYMPIYFFENGLNEILIGIFISTLSIPLIFGEYKITKLETEKNVRMIIFVGYLIIAVVSLLVFTVDNVLFAFFVLPISMLGLASIEPSKEMYFFNQVKNKEDQKRFFPIYYTAMDLGIIITSLIFGTYFAISKSYEYSFLIAALVITVILFIIGRRIVNKDLIKK